MLIRVDQAAFVDDLCAHFRRSGFIADPAGRRTVHVEKPDARSYQRAETEILSHLKVWQLRNPDGVVELLAEAPVADDQPRQEQRRPSGLKRSRPPSGQGQERGRKSG
jgi:hypothetical protein